jgi:ferrochelatase
VDCLETLEEIAMRGREIFLRAGGTQFQYVPALNDRGDHARALAQLVLAAAGT